MMTLEVVSPGSANAPLTFAEWQVSNSISGMMSEDSDLDGAVDFEEYVAGSDPNNANKRPSYRLERREDEGGFIIELVVSRLAAVRVAIEANDALNNESAWSELLPKIVDVSPETPQLRRLHLYVPKDEDASQQFWRFDFNPY
jgi:hypothetical protein